jgi:hypothetical protein
MANPPAFQFPQVHIRLSVLMDDVGQEKPKEQIDLPGPPISAGVENNPYNEADTAQVVFAFDDYPFDPRILLGGTLEIFVADVGEVKSGFFDNLSGQKLRDTCVYSGVIDESVSKIGSRGWFATIKSRDYTSIFMDVTVKAGEILFTNGGSKLSLLDVIEAIVGDIPAAKQLEIDDRDEIADSIYPADYMARASEETDDEDEDTSKFKLSHGTSAWEVMQELCINAGLIIYVELDKLVIRRPTSLFAGEEPKDGSILYLIGGNVSEVTYRREFGRRGDVHVQVTSYDADEGETLIARSPKEDFELKKLAASEVGGRKSKTTTVQVVPYVVDGVTDQDHLQTIADELRETLIHHELEVEIETRSLYDALGKKVTAFKYGDSLKVGLSDTIIGIAVKTDEEQIQALLDRGWKRADAEKVTSALEKLRNPFYVHERRLAWDRETGLDVTIVARSRQEVKIEDQEG